MLARLDRMKLGSDRRYVPRIALFVALGIILVLGGTHLVRKIDVSRIDYDVEVVPASIPADGSTSAILRIKLISRFGNALDADVLDYPPIVRIVRGAELIRLLPLDDSLRYRIVPNFTTGTVDFLVTIQGAPAPIEARLDIVASLADRNRNGYPDAIDLSSETDRTAFRRWFTTIALAQLTHLDDRWHDRDCAGLLRYCYREALRKHDSAWLARRKWLLTAAIPDVKKYSYPDVPIVGARVFNSGAQTSDGQELAERTSARRPGSWSPLHAFTSFAEAARLKDNSMAFLSRMEGDALPGDVLIYLNDTESDWPYHMMIYLGGGATVYHTGPDGDNPGRVKRLTLSELASHPNPRWHPVQQNRYFLGFYRWRILT